MVSGKTICEPKLSLTVLDVFNYDFGNDSKSEGVPLVAKLLNGMNLSEGLLSENHQLHLKIDCFLDGKEKKPHHQQAILDTEFLQLKQKYRKDIQQTISIFY